MIIGSDRFHDFCRCVFLNIPDDTLEAGFSMPTHYPVRMTGHNAMYPNLESFILLAVSDAIEKDVTVFSSDKTSSHCITVKVTKYSLS